jgi:MYND finger
MEILMYILCYQICWNCSRPASETCSGCKVAKYCGSFCQHKDWESHHRICRASQEELAAAAAGRLAAGSGGRGAEDHQPDQPVSNGHGGGGGGSKSAGASPKEF